MITNKELTALDFLKKHEDISYMWGMISILEAMEEYSNYKLDLALKEINNESIILIKQKF